MQRLVPQLVWIHEGLECLISFRLGHRIGQVVVALFTTLVRPSFRCRVASRFTMHSFVQSAWSNWAPLARSHSSFAWTFVKTPSSRSYTVWLLAEVVPSRSLGSLRLPTLAASTASTASTGLTAVKGGDCSIRLASSAYGSQGLRHV